MRVVITGGAGFVGLKLAEGLVFTQAAWGPTGVAEHITEIVLFDAMPPRHLPEGKHITRVTFVQGDIADAAAVEALFAGGANAVYHLAAVVSAAAEADLDLGLRVNLDGTRHVLDACRRLPAPPRFIFASSAAVYGGDPPFEVTDATWPTPRTSYGAQKLMGEILVSDYSRKGIIDGRSLRFPTIVVRPGKPNKAASTFASSILREPLSGQAAICPVTADSRMAILSPRRVIDCIRRVQEMSADELDGNRTVQLPSLSVSIGEMVEGLRRVGGDDAAARIEFRPDPHIQRIVDGWPGAISSARAARLELPFDTSIDDIIAAFVEDDLPAQKALIALEGAAA